MIIALITFNHPNLHHYYYSCNYYIKIIDKAIRELRFINKILYFTCISKENKIQNYRFFLSLLINPSCVLSSPLLMKLSCIYFSFLITHTFIGRDHRLFRFMMLIENVKELGDFIQVVKCIIAR